MLSSSDTNELAPAFTPVVWIVRVLHESGEATDYVADLDRACQRLWLAWYDGAWAVHFRWAFHPA
jgi:hypothetical protein